MPHQKLKATVGNIGLYYTCYRLSRYGWNVMPTSRNARGIDVLAYSQNAKRIKTIQVKSLSKPAPVPLGKNLDNLFADFIVICQYAALEMPDGTKILPANPNCFIMTPQQVSNAHFKGKKIASLWLQRNAYERDEFRERWDLIGSGVESDAAVGRVRNNRSAGD